MQSAWSRDHSVAVGPGPPDVGPGTPHAQQVYQTACRPEIGLRRGDAGSISACSYPPCMGNAQAGPRGHGLPFDRPVRNAAEWAPRPGGPLPACGTRLRQTHTTVARLDYVDRFTPYSCVRCTVRTNCFRMRQICAPDARSERLRGPRHPTCARDASRCSPCACRASGHRPAYSPITDQRKPIMMKKPVNMAIRPMPP
jgi:hypothetical protein